MKKKIKNLPNETKLFILHGFGFLFMCFYGYIIHDLAQLMPNFFSYMLFPSNLSLWEQGKILLTGMTVWFIVEYALVGRKMKGFVFIHTIIASALPILMLIIYMSHSTIFDDLSTGGPHIILTIALILLGFFTSVIMTLSKKDYSVYAPYGIVIYIVVILVYTVFTFLPPEASMFYDAENFVYGPVW